MSEQTDAPQGGADGATASEAVENNSEATAEQTTGADEAGQADDAGEAAEEPSKRVPWFQKRIDEVTAKKYEAEREAAYWKGVAESKGTPQAQTQPAAETLPTLEQFDYDEARYQQALAEAIEKRTERALDQRLSQREQQRTEEQKNSDAIAKIKAGGAKFPDFIAAVSGIAATEAVRDFALADDNAASVLYEIGKDPEASARFNTLSPVQQAIELGRRAATPKATTSRTIAPPPPQTVAGIVSGIGKTPDEMSMAEYAKWVKERDKT